MPAGITPASVHEPPGLWQKILTPSREVGARATAHESGLNLKHAMHVLSTVQPGEGSELTRMGPALG